MSTKWTGGEGCKLGACRWGNREPGSRGFRNSPLPLGFPGWGEGVMRRRMPPGWSPPGVGSRPRAVPPQTRTVSHPHPGPNPGAEHWSSDRKLPVPRRRASLQGSRGTRIFLQSHSNPASQDPRSGVSDLPPFLHVAAADSRRKGAQGDTLFWTEDPGSGPEIPGPASRQSSPGSGTRCRRPAPADPPPCLCLRRPTARRAPPLPGSLRAAPWGGRSRRWAGTMPLGWSRQTPWLQ